MNHHLFFNSIVAMSTACLCLSSCVVPPEEIKKRQEAERIARNSSPRPISAAEKQYAIELWQARTILVQTYGEHTINVINKGIKDGIIPPLSPAIPQVLDELRRDIQLCKDMVEALETNAIGVDSPFYKKVEHRILTLLQGKEPDLEAVYRAEQRVMQQTKKKNRR